MNVFDLLAVAVWIGVITSSVLLLRGLRQSRPPTLVPAPRLHDLSEAAFMAGGPGAVVDAALVSLLCDGRMLVGGPGIVQVRPGVRGGDPAQRAVLQACQGAPSGWLYQIRYAAMRDPAVQETGDALAARGLIATPGGRHRWLRHGVIQAVVCGVLLILSLPLSFVAFVLQEGAGSVRVPFIAEVLPVLLGGIVVGTVSASRARQRITPAGAAALRAVRAHYGADQSPYVQTSLFGLRGLRDPYLREQLVPAARGTRLAAAQSRTRSGGSGSSWESGAEVIPVVWCAGSDGGGSDGGGGSGGSGCGSSGSVCGSSGSGCGGGGSSGSSCSGSSGGSSCSSGSSGSSCSSSSSSSCSSSS
ncbi:TIGR04222 domain-containing membrane protein [Streptomyces sp. NBC_00193]|uniref:TIGR04222 domain-containing membrane protein n=1 Tax=Streptomyces sp. NBC_00193 TaxID=2975675 RepID=UPI00224E040A|nr:TIGR04222 domain-containing membrane protein [Streptomyces sp. NBC_00193]MCX5295153.1 TIGR04222 domain-containing membrane protein [Streptomyces sp. NBC_00193]